MGAGAEREGMAMAAWLGVVGVRAAVPPADAPVDPGGQMVKLGLVHDGLVDLRRILRNVGGNLNDVARHANTTGAIAPETSGGGGVGRSRGAARRREPGRAARRAGRDAPVPARRPRCRAAAPVVIAKISRGWSAGNLLRYLMGPGRANEHVDQRVIATWDGAPELHQPQPNTSACGFDVGDLIDDLTDPALAGRVPLTPPTDGRRGRGPVWHCSLRNHGQGSGAVGCGVDRGRRGPDGPHRHHGDATTPAAAAGSPSATPTTTST